jgi:hypothetical protein
MVVRTRHYHHHSGVLQEGIKRHCVANPFIMFNGNINALQNGQKSYFDYSCLLNPVWVGTETKI